MNCKDCGKPMKVNAYSGKSWEKMKPSQWFCHQCNLSYDKINGWMKKTKTGWEKA